MTVRYTVVDADLSALRRLLQSRPEGRRAIARERITGLLGGFVVATAFYLAAEARWLGPPLAALPILLGATIVLWTPLYLYSLRRADARCIAAWRETAGGEHEMTLTDEGVHESRPQGTVFHRWAFVQDICDRPEHLFMLLGQNGAYTVPKRDLSAEDRAGLPRAALDLWNRNR